MIEFVTMDMVDGLRKVGLVNAYQMIPMGESRRLRISTDATDWHLVEKVHPSFTVRPIGAVPSWPRLPAFSSFTLALEASSSVAGLSALKFMSSLHEVRVLLVSVLPRRNRTYTLALISGDAIRRNVVYKRDEIDAATRGFEYAYETQANVKFTRQPTVILDFPDEDLGDPILWDYSWRTVIAKLPPRATHNNLIFCWNVERVATVEMSLGLTTRGTGTSIVDRGQTWETVAHEIGHQFGLGDERSADIHNIMHFDENITPPFTFNAVQIETINGFNPRETLPF